MILNALKTIIRGFLLGVGFSASLGAAYLIAWHFYMSQFRAEIADGFGGSAAEFDTKNFILSDVTEQKHDGVTAIVGSVKNSGSAPANIKLRANLFDHGKFVDQYSTYLSGKLRPGESQYFKISCGCKDSPPAQHDSFKVEVVNDF